MSPPTKLSDSESDENEFTIAIEYDGFVTRFDLDEILSSIDRIIEFELLDYWEPEFRFLRRRHPNLWTYWDRAEPEVSYIGIKSIESGSILLGVFFSGAVVGYVARRFKKGVDKSLFAEELERSGALVGNVAGIILQRINDWAEKYVPKQRELGGRVTKIAATPRRRKSSDEENKP